LKVYNTKVVARFLNLSERRVRQLKDEGVIKEYNSGSGLYELMPTLHAYIGYINSQSGGGVDYKVERARLAKAKREDVELDVSRKKGELHSAEEVAAAMADSLVNFKSRLAAIPAKLSPILSKKSDVIEVHDILKAAIDEALREFAKYGETHS
jgi:phage terminase Nu1 subunit (DNA packaging protein)